MSGVTIKSHREIELMREAGKLLAQVHNQLAEYVKPGISTWELDKIGEELIRKTGAVPSFLNYEGYPASVCVSVNDEVVHGIPKKDRYLKEGVKQRHQGNIEKDFWWKYLDEDSVNLGTKLDEMLHTDKAVQESVFEPLRILESYLDNYSKLYCIRQYLATKTTDVWNLGQYYDNVLFCEVKKGELHEEGRPYFDIQLGKNGKEATFFIGNRDKDQGKLEATIKRTGILIKNGKTCADYENILLADIPEKALEMMKLIASN